MAPESDPEVAKHIADLTAAELAVANRQLAEAGRTIEELRSDAIALAKRVDVAREEAESYKAEVQEALERARAAEAETREREDTMAELEAHIARLKTQLDSPGRLLVKKALKQGRYKSDRP